MKHLCHAHGCQEIVPPALLMCRPHWYSLRETVRIAIWREYRRGQEIDKDASKRYSALQRFAVAEVAFKEAANKGDQELLKRAAAYRVEAEKRRQRCLDEGLGDPLAGLTLGEGKEGS